MCIVMHTTRGIRKAEAVYDFTKRSEVKLSPNLGRKFLVSDSELRNLTPNPSLSATRNMFACFLGRGEEWCEFLVVSSMLLVFLLHKKIRVLLRISYFGE